MSDVAAAESSTLRPVYRYIDLNPVRAAIVEAPHRYRWSSGHGNHGRLADPVLTPHECFAARGDDADARGSANREWLTQGICAEELAYIRNHLAQERALGCERFQRMVEEPLGRPVALRPRGRPGQDGLNVIASRVIPSVPNGTYLGRKSPVPGRSGHTAPVTVH